MQVYKCLDSIISKIEKNHDKNKMLEKVKIIKAKTKYESLVLININRLKKSKRLVGADVFNLLFKLTDDSPFLDIPMETDKDGYITILKELGISTSEWNLFSMFIRLGIVPYYKEYMNGGDNYKAVISNLETLNIICNKFGGIPSFDNFYNKFYKDEKKIIDSNEYYNPKNRDEDVENKYRWSATNLTGTLLFTFQQNHVTSGWDLASIHQSENRSTFYWYRKLKDNQSQETNEPTYGNNHTIFSSSDNEFLSDSDLSEDVLYGEP